jgi:hypothetical protein
MHGGSVSKVEIRGHGHLSFKCPGCGQTHTIGVGAGPGPRWDYNGDPDAPTFMPSVLARSGHRVDGDMVNCWCKYNAQHPDEPDPFICTICHSFVTDGRIQFLDDCTHALAGQTVDLPDWGQS